MSSAVLFLDADWRPLRVESWTRAIADTFNGKVEVVEYSRDKTIQGVNRTYPMPSVVRILRRFNRNRQAVKFSRINIYTRDKFACQYCSEPDRLVVFPTEDLTFDHVVPRAQGGKTDWFNIVTACVPCNSLKADRTPEQVKVHRNGEHLLPCDGRGCGMCAQVTCMLASQDADEVSAGNALAVRPMKLLHKPKKPAFLPVVMVFMDRKKIPPEWEGYWEASLEK